jgi:hypothetical protein
VPRTAITIIGTTTIIDMAIGAPAPLRLRVSKAISTKAIDEMATQTGPWPRLRFPSSSVRTEESCLSGSNERGALQSELCEPPPALIEKHI